MKISFSPSSSVSSSSLTSSLDRNLNNSENVTTKCFSSIIRRFLCSGNLRTHPFDSSIKQVDRVVEFDHQKDLKTEEKIQAPATPGLVARLMGLDSMPDLNLGHPDSIGRSRSVNSMDCRLESDQTHGGHRRAKTSLSFRERPTFLEQENDEFLILSFENVGESKEFGSKGRKLSEMGCGELKQKKENGSENRASRGEQRVFDQNKEDKHINKRNCAKYKQQQQQQEMMISSSKPCRKDVERREIKGLDSAPPSPKKLVSYRPKDRLNRIKHKEVSDGSKLSKKNRPTVEPECNSENSSPVSVLDIDDFEFEQGSISSEEEEEEESRKSGLNLTPDVVVVNSDRPSIHFTRISISEVPEWRSIESQRTVESTKEMDTHSEEDYIQLWGKVCKLTEEDMKTSNWIMPTQMQKMEELEEIGTGFGLEILNQLLHEIATELEEFPLVIVC